MSKKATKKKRQKRSIPRLCVGFDTNVLFTEAAHYLLSRDVYELIDGNSNHLDLRIEWYLPSVVIGEREYQMQRRALALFGNVKKLGKLLGHQTTTEEIIFSRIRSTIDDQIDALNIQVLEPNLDEIDWGETVKSSVYRRPPFDPGENEKGFRDALISESFLQLITRLPSTPSQCRVAIVCDDGPMRSHVEDRTNQLNNVRVLKNIGELEGLINTLVSEVPESTVMEWGEKAGNFFYDFSKQDGSSFYEKQDIGKSITESFPARLAETPGTQFIRQNGNSTIWPPVFVKKDRQRIYWATQIAVNFDLFHSSFDSNTGLFSSTSGVVGELGRSALNTQSREKAGTGLSIFEVHWSVSISPQYHRLSAPKVERIEFIENKWKVDQGYRNVLADLVANYQPGESGK